MEVRQKMICVAEIADALEAYLNIKIEPDRSWELFDENEDSIFALYFSDIVSIPVRE